MGARDEKELKRRMKEAARRFPDLAIEGAFSSWGDPEVFVRADAVPEGPYEVLLESAPNVDLMYGQERPGATPGYWQGAAPLARSWAPAASLAAASQLVGAMIRGHGLGGGNWTGGAVRLAGDESGKLVARISYNGRVWLPGAHPTPEVRL